MHNNKKIKYMAILSVKTRKETGKKTENLRKKGIIPAVLYGPGVKDVLVEVGEKDFEKVFKQTGESSLVDLKIDGEKENRKVFIHDVQKDAVTDKFMHADFFQASLKDEIEVKIPLVFEGVSFAVKDLGANLVKNITEIEVKALPHNLPHDIKVSIDGLLKIGDHILVKDLIVPKEIKIMKKPDEIIVSAVEPEKVEEELEKPIEEKVEEVEKVEKEKKEEIVEEEDQKK
ncbi:MAG: 50S ribosomal protein L25 [Candidatus Staskawiczbacteria bacterium]|nr:50S ribosomal protein L25 [Candidatus Staskawiczbacteria bacterium]